MDKKNTAIGVGLIVAAVGLLFWNQKREADYERAHPRPVVAPAKPAVAGSADVVKTADTKTPSLVVETPAAPEQLYTLENDTVRVVVTSHGAGVKTVALLKHASELGKDAAKSPVLFNEFGDVPALAVSFPDAEGRPVAWTGSFVPTPASTPAHLVLEAKRADGLVVTREFSFPTPAEAGKKPDKKPDPHVVRVVTTFRRDGVASDKPVAAGLNLGTLPPSENDPHHQFLNVSAFAGSAYEKIGAGEFPASSGMFGFGAHPAKTSVAFTQGAGDFSDNKPFGWFAVSNQFFAGIATVDAKERALVTGLAARPVDLPDPHFPKDKEGRAQNTVTGDIGLSLGVLKPGEAKTVGVNWFVGPKEYARLAALGEGQENVVQFSKVFGVVSMNWLCSLLMASLAGIHALLAWIMPSNAWNWGWAIIILTLIVRGSTWPLTAMQLKSGEAMKKLQKPMAELKEKYKDDPQRVQKETMKLYRDHKVNPLAGCLPVVIQIPVFCALYYAFQTCAELRHHPFLWFPDLSAPDTLTFLPPGIAPHVHILPVLMGFASFANMKFSPTPMGTDSNQKMIFYGMMILFPVMCYSLPAGLTTYYTMSNSLTLLQTWQRRRKTAAAEAAGPAIEVIPPKKKKAGNTKR